MSRLRTTLFLTASLLGIAGCAAAGTGGASPGRQAQPSGGPLVQALSAIRTQGCQGRPGQAGGLREVAALNDAARRMARGAAAEDATRQAGYRARSFVQIQLSGYASADAVARAVAQRHCASLTESGLSEVGVFQQGSQWWVLLAQPFEPPAAAHADDVAARVLALVNQARGQARRCGDQSFGAAGPLRLDPRLAQAAQAHSRDMARRGVLEHRGGDGSQVSHRVERAGYDWGSVAENIASGQESPQEVVAGWLRSPGHCVNIMDPRFTDMGLAYVVDRGSAAGIYWTQVFGRPRR